MSDISTPSFAVIIPHYNDLPRLRTCLAALMAQDRAGVEIIVVDNNSPVNLAPLEAEFPEVRFLVETEKGAGPARNHGVAATKAPWILFIDADCVPAPDWLAVGREIAREDAVIGGRVDVFDETPPPRSGAEAFETVFAFHMKDYLEKKAFLGAGNLVLPRRVFDVAGGFRPAVSEDVEWSQRAARHGFTLAFEDRFAVGHPSRQDWPALRRKWLRLTEESYRLSEGGLKTRLAWAGRALLMPASALAHLPHVLRHRKLTLRERLRGAGTLIRLRMARAGWMLRQALLGRA